jgi:lipopolysaccharide transport system ATP-binding protein
MTQPVISVRGLSKKYRLGATLSHNTLRDQITHSVKSLWYYFRSTSDGQRADNKISTLYSPSINSEFWALKDISFDVLQGEVVGIIGRNGAGKSTLLKILSQITEPTKGEARIRGRVASLLEVGTGFHPELSGRENIFLNGAILGMTKAEIKKKFDEIVNFAEIEKFIDTPVKRYSSGMYVRLAFAVAAHLEPEILLVDEVLAVGDAAFQKKCLGKMGDVAREGRTVLFVSHNMGAVQALCERAFLLDTGRLVIEGTTQKVVQGYLQSVISAEVIPLDQRRDRSGDGSARMVSLRIESTDPDKVIRSSSRLKVTIGYRSEKPVLYPKFLVGIYDYTNAGIFLLDSDAAGGLPQVLPAEGSVTCVTEPINLTTGRCYVNIALMKGGTMADYIQYAGYFDVEAEDVYGSGKVPPRDWVLCVLRHRWSVEEGRGYGHDFR